MKKAIAVTFLSVFLAPCVSEASIFALPSPDLVIDGIPVSSKIAGPFSEDFVTYSTSLLQQLQSSNAQDVFGNTYASYLPSSVYGDFSSKAFDDGARSRKDLIIYTQATGNQAKFNGASLENPIDSATGSLDSFRGTWGAGDFNFDGQVNKTNESNGMRITVGDVLDILPGGSSTPVFVYDNNEGEQDKSFSIRGTVRVLDSSWDFSSDLASNISNGNLLGQWNFDNKDDGIFTDMDSANVLVPDGFSVTGVHSNETFNVSNNRGTNVSEFMGYAPGMNLNQFDRNAFFTVTFELDGLSNGFDELFIAGDVRPVPEPSTVAVWGLIGMVGAGFAWRRRRKLSA